MSPRSARLAAALCGFLGFATLGIYYSVPFPLPPPTPTLDQLVNDLHGYQRCEWSIASRDCSQRVDYIAPHR